MKNKKKTKSKSKKKSINKKGNGLAKIASITTKSLSNAFTNFKKNQELKKIKVEMKDRKYAERLQRNQEKRERVRAESISHERAKWMKDEELSKCPYVVFV